VHWFELAIAAFFGAVFTAFRVFPSSWGDPFAVRLTAGVFVVATAMLYLWFVDDERRPKAGALHRMLVAGSAGLLVAAITNGSGELYALLGLAGALAGYVGFRWLKHVPL
jgi:hypothetical protein